MAQPLILPPRPLELREFFLELQKSSFFLSGPALSGPEWAVHYKNIFFSASLTLFIINSESEQLGLDPIVFFNWSDQDPDPVIITYPW